MGGGIASQGAVAGGIGLDEFAGPVSALGVGVETVVTRDHRGLTRDEQAQTDAIIARLEEEAELRPSPSDSSPFLDGSRFPSMPEWMALRKSALALHPIYRGAADSRFGEGLPDDAFTAPLFDGVCAEDKLRQLLARDRADRIIQRHRAFVSAPISREARLILAGAIDAYAVRSRANVAARLIRRHFSRRQVDVRVASVACGAAGPVAEAAAGLRMSGVEVMDLTLLDRDPMALAAGYAVARRALADVPIGYVLVDLVDLVSFRAIDLQPFCGGGWDVVDILGLFEYLPDQLATDLLRQAAGACTPGGIIVVANMLDVRPQQTFFDRVAQWPAVVQRSPLEFVKLITASGIDPGRVSLVLSASAPVYAVAAITTE